MVISIDGTSSFTYDDYVRGRPLNVAIVRSDSASITFNALMPEYLPFRDYVLEHVSAGGRRHGESEIPLEERRRIKQGVAAVSVIFLLVAALIAAATVPEARHKIEMNELLDRNGRTITGMVTGLRETSGKSSHYYVDYAYLVGNRRFDASNEISGGSYASFRERQQIQVTYLLDQPGVARVPFSIDRAAAQSDMNGMYELLALPIVVPVMVYFSVSGQKKAKERG